MTRPLVLALFLAACTSHDPPAGTPATTPAPPASPPKPAPYVDVDVESCRLSAEPEPPPALHPRLKVVAPQYFHAGGPVSGFDGYIGGDEFPWFDAEALDTPYLAPAGSRVVVATPATYVLNDLSGQLGTVDRAGGAPRWIGERLYPVDAGDAGDVRWILARADATWRLLRLAGEIRVTDLGVPQTTHDVRLAVTADARPVVAWLEREGGTLRIRMRAEPNFDRTETVDERAVAVAVAERSVLSTVELALAADGPTGVAFAWRPLVGEGTPGSDETWIPTHPYDAEVRWRSVDREGRPAAPARIAPTGAERPSGGSGMGPIGARPKGLVATRLGGRAMFAWHGDGGVDAARVDHDTPTRLLPPTTDALIVLRPGRLLLLESTGKVVAHALRCR